MDEITCANCYHRIKVAAIDVRRAEIVHVVDDLETEEYTVILNVCPSCNHHWVSRIEDKYTRCLDALSDSGIPNKYNAARLAEHYPELSYGKAERILHIWMKERKTNV